MNQAILATRAQLERPRPRPHGHLMVTGEQLRAARGLKLWSVSQAAKECGVSYKTIQRAEAAAGVPHLRASTLEKIQRAYEAAGIEFIAANRNGTGGVGVRLRRQP